MSIDRDLCCHCWQEMHSFQLKLINKQLEIKVLVDEGNVRGRLDKMICLTPSKAT